MNLIVERQLEQLRRSQEVYSRLTQLALNSQGLANIVKAIAELVENPVILEDCCLNLLALSWPGIQEVASGHPLLQHRLSAACIQRLQRTAFISTTLFNRQKSVLREVLATPAGPVEQVIWPVIAGQEVFGFLTVLLANKQDKEQDMATLEHGSNIIALELLKERTTMEAVGRTQADLLHYVLESEHVSEEELKRKAALLGINVNKPTCVMVIHCEMPRLPVPAAEHIVTVGGIPHWVAAWVEQVVQGSNPSARVIGRDRDIVAFLNPADPGSGQNFIREAKLVGQTIARGLMEKHPGIGVFIGIGRPYTSPRQIQRSYREARTVVDRGSFLGEGTERVVTFPEIGIYRFLSVIKDSEELEAFWQDLIGTLVAYDRRHGAKLVETLETFLRNNENQAETARRLFVHVNSLNYRLQRIGELLGVDLRDAETRLLLHLAIMIYKSGGAYSGESSRAVCFKVAGGSDGK
jgi:purine catabolism regulator